MSNTPEEIEIDDEELELAAGGIIIAKNPTQENPNSTSKYNTTIYLS